MGFSQALSGLNSAATNLDVIGNNIANSQTVGFKSSTTLFSDVFAGAKAGLGTRVAAVLQNFNTGTLESTSRNLDLAIDGTGFFRLVQNDQVVYSRNGQFTMDESGFITNAQGARLTGYPAGVQPGGNPVTLQVPSGALLANPSTAVEATFNLDGNSDDLDAGAFDQNDASTYSYANNVTLFDSLGNAHNTTMYFIKSDAGVNEWVVRMSRQGELATQQGTANFDTNGILTGFTVNGTGTFDFTPGANVEPMNIALDLGETTQFGNDFELSAVNQDGYASGSLVGIVIDDNGNIIGNYSNEQSDILGVIAMANFTNPEGLDPVGDNAWVETTNSGQPLMGLANSGMFGAIASGVVENSNVDLTRELVNLIIAQRNYQANAQTIKVQDEVLQNAVNLR